jgi:hypothetical protein
MGLEGDGVQSILNAGRGRTITIEIPTTAAPPDVPVLPRETFESEVRRAPLELGQRIIQRDGRDLFQLPPVYSLVRSLWRSFVNLAALAIIVIGLILLLRQGRQPKEKTPTTITSNPD